MYSSLSLHFIHVKKLLKVLYVQNYQFVNRNIAFFIGIPYNGTEMEPARKGSSQKGKGVKLC